MNLLTQHSKKIIELAITYAPRVGLALLTLIIGLWIIRSATRLAGRAKQFLPSPPACGHEVLSHHAKPS